MMQEAEPLYLRAIAVCEERLGPDHPTLKAVGANYARLRQAMAGGL
jgi:hypothetical protein